MIELMVVVVLMAIIVAFAVPSFETTINSNRLAGASNELMASVQTARMEAVRRNARVALCLSANADTNAPTCGNADANGWIVFTDIDKDSDFDTGTDTLLRVSTIPSNVVVQSSATPAGKVSFRSDGFARTGTGQLLAGAIDLCIATRRPPENIRHVLVAAGSRVSIARDDAGALCPVPADDP
jgi:type IV fimbrial biogenesis protein FimT